MVALQSVAYEPLDLLLHDMPSADHLPARRSLERRRIGPVIRKLERTVDPLFRQAGMRLP